MFLLVPAYPGCPGQTAVKWLLLVVVLVEKVMRLVMSVCLLSQLTFDFDFFACMWVMAIAQPDKACS